MFVNSNNYMKYKDILNKRRDALLKEFSQRGEIGFKRDKSIQYVETGTYKGKYGPSTTYKLGQGVPVYDLDNEKIVFYNTNKVFYYREWYEYTYGIYPSSSDIVLSYIENWNNKHIMYIKGNPDYYYVERVVEYGTSTIDESLEDERRFIFRTKDPEKVEKIDTIFKLIRKMRSYDRGVACRGIGNLLGFANYIIKNSKVDLNHYNVSFEELEHIVKQSYLLSKCIPFTSIEDAEKYITI
jgi:hypothetical protein